MFSRLRPLALLVACLSMVLSTAAFADGSHDRTHFGSDISIGPGEQVSEVTCFGCSVRVRGQVSGDVTTFGGNIVVEDQGEVKGDATSFAGDVRMDEGVHVGGDITVFEGHFYRTASATVGGEVTNFSGKIWLVLIFGLPFVFLGAFIALIVWLVRLLMHRAVPAAA